MASLPPVPSGLLQLISASNARSAMARNKKSKRESHSSLSTDIKFYPKIWANDLHMETFRVCSYAKELVPSQSNPRDTAETHQ